MGLALQYWLSSVSNRQQLYGLVLADACGLVVASSQKCPQAEEMAAMAPLMKGMCEGDAQSSQTSAEAMSIHQMMVEETRLYVCAVGDQQRGQEGAEMAASGVERILAEIW